MDETYYVLYTQHEQDTASESDYTLYYLVLMLEVRERGRGRLMCHIPLYGISGLLM